jgi:hypothetical protein
MRQGTGYLVRVVAALLVGCAGASDLTAQGTTLSLNEDRATRHRHSRGRSRPIGTRDGRSWLTTRRTSSISDRASFGGPQAQS